jgi:hypothetical protein
VQQTVRLFDWCHDHVAEVVARVVSAPDKFVYLALMVVQALFGYFSSAEHINLGMKFYVSVLSIATADLGGSLCAPGMFSLFDSALQPFFDRFLCDRRGLTDGLARAYSGDLARLFAQNAGLIPHTHRVVLRLMETQWGVAGRASFLPERLLKPTTVSWLDYMCRCDLKPALLKILNGLPSVDITEQICKTGSLFEVPFQYVAFEDTFLLFLACPDEVATLYQLVLKIEGAAQTLRMLAEEKAPQGRRLLGENLPEASPR